MRLIPGKTKVKIELFRGITLADVIVALVGLGIAALCAVSSLPYRWIIAACVMGVFGMMIVRVNDEPLYIFFWHMLRYQAFPRRFYRIYDDKALVRMHKGDRQENMDAFYEEESEADEESYDPAEEKKKLKEIIKAENKILKSKTATEEEKNEVWLARAKRSAEKKKRKNAFHVGGLYHLPATKGKAVRASGGASHSRLARTRPRPCHPRLSAWDRNRRRPPCPPAPRA